MNPETKQALHRELTRLRHDVTLGIQSKANGICCNTLYGSEQAIKSNMRAPPGTYETCAASGPRL